MTNKEIGDAAEDIVIKHFKEQDIHPIRVSDKRGKGYDIKAGDKLIEVKGTEKSSIRDISFFPLTSMEFSCACQNKNFWLYCVDVINKRIMAIIPRDEVLENAVIKKFDVTFRIKMSKIEEL